jgi:hypothetical protein
VKAHRKSQPRKSITKKGGVAEDTVKIDNKAASKGLRWHRPKKGFQPCGRAELDELWRRVKKEKAEKEKEKECVAESAP